MSWKILGFVMRPPGSNEEMAKHQRLISHSGTSSTHCTDGHQTNNHLESNRTFNKLAGQNPNVWKVQELFRSQEADTGRRFLNNAVGLDKSTNTGRKQRSMDRRGRLKFIADSYATIPRKEYITMIAHELMKQDYM